MSGPVYAPAPYELEFFTEESGHAPALRWIRDELSPTKRRALGAAMQEVLQWHGVQVVGERSWGRHLGGGLFEFRLDRTVKSTDHIVEKLALRVFCHAHGDRKILVLHGYDKGTRTSPHHQRREIEVARARLRNWEAKQAGQRKRSNRDRRRARSSKRLNP